MNKQYKGIAILFVFMLLTAAVPGIKADAAEAVSGNSEIVEIDSTEQTEDETEQPEIVTAEGSEQTAVSSEETDVPSETDITETTDTPETTDAPDTTDVPDTTDAPETTNAAEGTETAAAADVPETAVIPEASDALEITDSSVEEAVPQNNILLGSETNYETQTDSLAVSQESVPAAFNIYREGETADRLHFLNLNSVTGSSDAAIIESNGLYGLIDASNPSGIYDNKYPAYTAAEPNGNGKTIVNYLIEQGVQHLAFVLSTHAHSDHIGGMLDVAESGLVSNETVYIYKNYEGTSEDLAWHNDYYADIALSYMADRGAVLLDTSAPSQTALNMLGAVFTADSTGDRVGDTISFTMGDFLIKLFNLYTESTTDENLNCIVTTVQKKDARAVLMADMQVYEGMEDRVVDAIVRNDGTSRTDVYKVGHHGYSGSTSAKTVETLRPRYAIISTNSKISSPEKDAYYNYLMGALGTHIFRTSESNSSLIAEFLDNPYNPDNSEVEVINWDSKYGRWALVEWKATYSSGWKTWVADASGTKSYLYMLDSKTAAKGWNNIGGTWYYFDNNYLMHKGWVESNSKWYYLDPGGAMHRGFLQSGGKWYYLDKNTGVMATGVKTIDGRTYSFDAKGAMKGSGWVGIGNKWYYLNADGSVSKGKIEVNGIGYYCDSNGAMQLNTWVTVDGKKYYFDNYGVMAVGPGWHQIGGKWYFLDAKGAAQTGLLEIGTSKYYLDASGVMVQNNWGTSEGKRYHFDKFGLLEKGPGWKQFDGKWYFLDAEGAAQTGLLEIGTSKYYLDANGAMVQNNWGTVEGKRYHFNSYGLQDNNPGWNQFNGKWYYLDADGAAMTGRLNWGTSAYYLDAEGAMVQNKWVSDGGKLYHFNSYGLLDKNPGWNQFDGKWYYLDADGAATTGRLDWGTSAYYLDANGAMVVNKWVSDGGKLYHFNSYGLLDNKPGFNQFDGKWYCLEEDGSAETGWQKKENNVWYYFNSAGVLQVNTMAPYEGKYYYLDKFGVMSRGPKWQNVGAYWYYLEANGAAATGMREVNGNYYYFNSLGQMQTNIWVVIDGTRYHFNGYGIRDN